MLNTNYCCLSFGTHNRAKLLLNITFLPHFLFQLVDSIYNVPRPLSVESQTYGTSIGSAVMTPNAAIDAGIYNVPRNLLMDDSRFSGVHEDAHFSIDGDTLDLYDYPRVSMSPDEEGIYDDPLDIVDMEIYDYPPDASELGLEYSDWITSESMRRNTVGESIPVDLVPSDNWKDQAVPPLPNTSRPALFGSAGFISDTSQVHIFSRSDIVCSLSFSLSFFAKCSKLAVVVSDCWLCRLSIA